MEAQHSAQRERIYPLKGTRDRTRLATLKGEIALVKRGKIPQVVSAGSARYSVKVVNRFSVDKLGGTAE